MLTQKRCREVFGMDKVKPGPIVRVMVSRENIAPTFLSPETGHLFVMNAIADRVLSVCDGRPSNEITELVSSEYEGASAAVVAEDVRSFLRSAVDVGAVAWNED